MQVAGVRGTRDTHSRREDTSTCLTWAIRFAPSRRGQVGQTAAALQPTWKARTQKQDICSKFRGRGLDLFVLWQACTINAASKLRLRWHHPLHSPIHVLRAQHPSAPDGTRPCGGRRLQTPLAEEQGLRFGRPRGQHSAVLTNRSVAAGPSDSLSATERR